MTLHPRSLNLATAPTAITRMFHPAEPTDASRLGPSEPQSLTMNQLRSRSTTNPASDLTRNGPTAFFDGSGQGGRNARR